MYIPTFEEKTTVLSRNVGKPIIQWRSFIYMNKQYFSYGISRIYALDQSLDSLNVYQSEV
jgi:hypothetical protein